MEQGTIKESVSKAISRALAVTRWNKETLAAEIGVQSSTLRRWANGEVEDFTLLPVANLFRFAGLSLDEALGLRASVPSKGVDDQSTWRERAEMYEGLLKILTRQSLVSLNTPMPAAGEGMSLAAMAKLPGLTEIASQIKTETDFQESSESDGESEIRRTGTG